eukprot:244042-Pyramimonas_sp.AAC.1
MAGPPRIGDGDESYWPFVTSYSCSWQKDFMLLLRVVKYSEPRQLGRCPRSQADRRLCAGQPYQVSD